MNRVYGISKDILVKYLKEGKTTREIGSELGIANTTISRYIRKYKLQNLYVKPKYPIYKLGSIDTKEKAYAIGFMIADSYINSNSQVELSIKYEDKELMDLFTNLFNCKFSEDLIKDSSKKRFPRVRLSRKIEDINKFLGGIKKENRNVPIVKKELEVYLLRGIFDADGCITWGHRKDRNRIWHKVTFSSTINILTSVQKILYKIGISSIIKPKKDENCYVLEFSNKKDVIVFYNYLYSDCTFLPLKRKYNHYQALRLELGEFSEGN